MEKQSLTPGSRRGGGVIWADEHLSFRGEGSPGRKLPENLYQLTAGEDPVKQICSEIEKVVGWVDIVE